MNVAPPLRIGIVGMAAADDRPAIQDVSNTFNTPSVDDRPDSSRITDSYNPTDNTISDNRTIAVAMAHLSAWCTVGATEVAYHLPNGLRLPVADAQGNAVGEGTVRIEHCHSLGQLLSMVDMVDASLLAARSSKMLEALADQCRQTGVRLTVLMPLRHAPQYAATRRLILSGNLGAPALLRTGRHVTSYPTVIDDAKTDVKIKPAGFVSDADRLFLELLLPDFDFAKTICGNVRRIFAWHVGSSAVATITHSNGSLSHIHGTYAQGIGGDSAVVYRSTVGTVRTNLEVACEKGVIEEDSDRTMPLNVRHYSDLADTGNVATAASNRDAHRHGHSDSGDGFGEPFENAVADWPLRYSHPNWLNLLTKAAAKATVHLHTSTNHSRTKEHADHTDWAFNDIVATVAIAEAAQRSAHQQRPIELETPTGSR